jgi:Neuraminidase (sialidase)
MLLLYGLPNGTVKLARSTNGGAALTQSIVASAATGRFAGDVAISGRKARLAYRQGGKIWTRSSTDGGATWAAADQAYSGMQVYGVNVVPAGTVTVIEFEPASSPFDTNVWARHSS